MVLRCILKPSAAASPSSTAFRHTVGSTSVLADVIAGALRRCGDLLLTRQLEDAGDAIAQEAARCFRGRKHHLCLRADGAKSTGRAGPMHPALAQLAFEGVAAGEAVVEALLEIGHWVEKMPPGAGGS